MSELAIARILVAVLAVALLACGAFLLHPASARAVGALPRAYRLGVALSALCWVWVMAQLVLFPIDFLAFLTPWRTIFGGIVCMVLTWVLLENLLCARAIGGVLLWWPMPVILAVREQVTLWREVPVVVGYLSLTIGMIVVFYPWVFRKWCEVVARRACVRRILAWSLLAVGLLTLCTLAALGEVIGEETFQ